MPVLLLLILGSCASLSDLIRKPEVTVRQIKPLAISFQEITLEMELLIENPNPVEINLEGYDYDFLIEGSSFLKGTQNDPLSISANSSSTVKVPLTVNYRELYKSLSSLQEDGESDYTIVTGLHFMLPVLGKQRLELSHEGTLPHVQKPKFSLASLEIEKLTLGGADLLVRINAENPNAFDFTIREMKGELIINRDKWADLKSLEEKLFPSGETTEMDFRFQLNFLSMGRGLYNILKERGTIDYNLEGGVQLGSSLELLGETSLPLSLSGKIDLINP